MVKYTKVQWVRDKNDYVFFKAVHEHGTIYIPELHTVPVAVGTDTHIKLKWELREKLNNPYGDCLENENEVGRL